MKFEKQKVKTSVIIGSVIIIVLLLGMAIGYAVSPSSTPWISPGIYPGAPTYTIWTESGNYFAKDANGFIEFSGTSATTIINNCIAKEGIKEAAGKIQFGKGNFSLDAVAGQTYCILVNNVYGLWLSGEGVDSTNLQLKDNQNADIIKILNSANIKISDMYLYGNKEHQTSGNGIIITSTTPWYFYDGYEIQHIAIGSCKNDGIYAPFTSTMITNRIRLSHIQIAGCDGDGVDLWGKYEVFIDTCTIAMNGENGIHCRGSGEAEIKSCNVFANQQMGLRIYDCTHMTIIGNYVTANNESGIIVSGISENIILDANLIYDNSEETANIYSGIVITDTAKNNVITSNSCFDTRSGGSKKQAWGIAEGGTTNYNLIVGNSCIGNAIGGIHTIGANTEVHCCFNGTSWVT